jgi:hypothetical protein
MKCKSVLLAFCFTMFCLMAKSQLLTIKNLETLLTNGYLKAKENTPDGFMYLKEMNGQIGFASIKGKPHDFLYISTDDKSLLYKLSSRANYLKLKSLITSTYKKDSKASERNGENLRLYYTPKFAIALNEDDLAVENYYLISIVKRETQDQTQSNDANKEVYKAKKIEVNKYEIDSYTNTTEVNIKKGEQITITAKGSITYGAWAGSGGPDGIDGYTSYNRIQGFRHGSLLVRIGDKAEWESVGTSKTIVAARNGVLQFIVNDADPSNNSGSFTVDLLIIKTNGELK